MLTDIPNNGLLAHHFLIMDVQKFMKLFYKTDFLNFIQITSHKKLIYNACADLFLLIWQFINLFTGEEIKTVLFRP